MILRREARSVGAGAGVAASRDPAASAILTVGGGIGRLGYWELAVSNGSQIGRQSCGVATMKEESVIPCEIGTQ